MTINSGLFGRLCAFFIAPSIALAAVTAGDFSREGVYSGGTISITAVGTVVADGDSSGGGGTSLSYAQGGAETDNPCPTGGDCYYVDPAGSDSNSGRYGSPWATLSKITASKASFTAGTHILLKEGGTWGENLILTSINGSSSYPIVIGSYGSSGTKPVVNVVRIDGSSYVTVRDLNATQIDASSATTSKVGASYFLIYKNTLNRESVNNPIRVFGSSHHGVIMENLVYNILGQDGITIHDINFGATSDYEDAGGSFWVVNNTVVGDSGVEDLIDHSQGYATVKLGGTCAGFVSDLKIVDNQLQQTAVSGLSGGTGGSNFGINSGHCGAGVWIIGNNISGDGNACAQVLRDDDNRRDIQVAGNVMYKCGDAPKYSFLYDIDNAYFEYNTVSRLIGSRASFYLKTGSDVINLNHNLLSIDSGAGTTSDHWVQLAETVAAHSFTETYNHFEDLDGTPVSAYIRDSAGNQAISGTSTEGTGASLTVPTTTLDPRTWSATIASGFTPDSGWSRCSNPAGAYTCAGVRQGRTLRPFVSTVGGDGYGWRGLPIVTQYIADEGLILE